MWLTLCILHAATAIVTIGNIAGYLARLCLRPAVLQKQQNHLLCEAHKGPDDDIKIIAEECPVCMDKMCHAQTMPCGHRICRNCVAAIFDSSVQLDKVGKAPCPLCRAPMPDVRRLVGIAGEHLLLMKRCLQDESPYWLLSMLEAVKCLCKQALTIDPGYAPAHCEMACAELLIGVTLAIPHERRARFVRAEASFAAAAAADPNSVEALHGLAEVRRERLRDMPGAEAAYRACLDINPRHAAAHVGLGMVLASKRPKDITGAEASFRAAIAARPAMSKAHLALGKLLEEERCDLEGALQAYGTALKSCVPYSCVARQRVEELLPRVAALRDKRQPQRCNARSWTSFVCREFAKAAVLFALANLALAVRYAL